MASLRTGLERFLIVWLTVLCWIAYRWPTWQAYWMPDADLFDPFVLGAGWLKPVFALTMLAIGSLLPADEVRQVLRRWPAVLGGTAIQYTVMPLLAYGVGRLFGFQGAWMIGLVIVGCVPGAMASNVLTLVARGNVSYSVSLTTSATILSPLVVPWVLWLALGRMVEQFPAWEVCGDLLWMVVLPVVTGHVLSRRLSGWSTAAQRWGGVVANLTVLWIIAVVVAANRAGVSQVDPWIVSALLLVNVGGYAAGYGGGRLLRMSVPMRRALTLEIGMQNAGLGTTLAMGLFPDQRVSLPAALYTFLCMFTGTLLARFWAEWRGPSHGVERIDVP